MERLRKNGEVIFSQFFCVIGKFSKLPYNTKTLREDRTASERDYVAHATSRRRRILRGRILCSVIEKFSKLPYNTKMLREDRTAAERDCVAHVLRRKSCTKSVLRKLFQKLDYKNLHKESEIGTY